MTHPLGWARVRFGPTTPAIGHAARLLALLGAEVVPDDSVQGVVLESPEISVTTLAAETAAGDWAESGAMALTGRADGPPLVAPGAAASAARGAAFCVELLSAVAADRHASMSAIRVDGAQLLSERAAIAGLGRRGDISPGGSCRLIRAADGLLAVNLARPDDVDLVPAWLEVAATSEEAWDVVTSACAGRRAAELEDRAGLLGIPVAAVANPPLVTPEPWRMTGLRPRESRNAPGVVVDLSSMWAGPLCANLLGLAGFDVVKVESIGRPDGARHGPREFYDLLHGGHASVALDFGIPSDIAELARLISGADIVIESSRPRALDHLGLGPAAAPPETIWISVTGYGRSGPGRNRVAFGDDAAAAAGLVARDDHGAVFCGDAIADPLAGLHAALAGLAMWVGNCGGVADVAMRDVVASTLNVAQETDHSPAAEHRDGGWVLPTGTGFVAVAEPHARPVREPARALGADTDAVCARRSMEP